MIHKPSILFLLVNYFNEEEVFSFVVHQLHVDTNDFVEIVIVDNGSKTNLLSELENKSSKITSIKAKTNLGYFGAANLGLTNYLDQHKEYPQAVVVCNTDMKLSVDFLAILQRKLTKENFDILGPSIHSSFLNYYQNPYILSRIKTSKLKFLQFVSSNYFLYSLFTIYHVVKTKTSRSNSVQLTSTLNPYAIHGSFMIFNKTFFQKGGTINYPSVLFGEELFIAEQAFKLNLNMVYDPALQVEHNEHATTGIFKSKETVAYLNQSYRYLLNTYFK
ncbi:MAG TPA: glycosyltransferase [Bacteroidia bacterium]